MFVAAPVQGLYGTVPPMLRTGPLTGGRREAETDLWHEHEPGRLHRRARRRPRLERAERRAVPVVVLPGGGARPGPGRAHAAGGGGGAGSGRGGCGGGGWPPLGRPPTGGGARVGGRFPPPAAGGTCRRWCS